MWTNREQKTMEKDDSCFQKVHHYSEQTEMANNCITTTMDPYIVYQFQKEKSMLYPCLQDKGTCMLKLLTAIK